MDIRSEESNATPALHEQHGRVEDFRRNLAAVRLPR